MLDIESQFVTVAQQNEAALTAFVVNKWHCASTAEFSKWTRYEKIPFLWFWSKCTTTKNDQRETLTVQISLNGELLVNNAPIDKLPDEFIEQTVYIDFFQKINFDVLPSTRKNNFVSQIKHIALHDLKVSYSFFSENDDDLIITETRVDNQGDSEEYQLVPKFLFDECLPLPHNLLHEYSHWLKKSTNCIEFREKHYASANYYTKVYYSFDLNTQCLLDLREARSLISISSGTFAEITEKITFRLEQVPRMFVHVFSDADGSISVELPRLGLSFQLDPAKKCVLSKEYHNMKVMNDQTIGTLIGLQKGLLLGQYTSQDEDDQAHFRNYRKLQLLVPHGNIYAVKDEGSVLS